MKISSILLLSILLISGSASAYDLTYLGPIKAHETKNVRVDIPSGQSTIEVFSSSKDTKFNCEFTSSYGGFVFEQKNTDKCLANLKSQSESSLIIQLTNLGNDSDYKIWVHDPQ